MWKARSWQRTWFGMMGVLIGVLGSAACTPSQISSASSATSTATVTLIPTATLPLIAPATATPTLVPSLMAMTPTPPPPAETPLPTPTEIAPPDQALPPQPDGVKRSAEVPILMYHYISAAPSARERIRYSLSVPPEMFEAQLRLLCEHGFSTITLRDVYEYLAVGKPLPDNPIVLTFDDGYIDNFDNAFPLLQKYGLTGTFFVLTGPADAGHPAYLSWDMIQAMSDAGMDVQLHARDHFDMRGRSFEWLFFQIMGGRQSIEGHTGKPVIFMAYPSGKYDASALQFLKKFNFWGAVTTAYGKTHTLDDALLWTRVRISGQLQLKDFARLLGIGPAAQRAVTATPPAALSSSPAHPNPSATTAAIVTLHPTVAPTPPTSPLPTPTIPASPLATPAAP